MRPRRLITWLAGNRLAVRSTCASAKCPASEQRLHVSPEQLQWRCRGVAIEQALCSGVPVKRGRHAAVVTIAIARRSSGSDISEQ
jgi:hypothetical protein